jgi:hypothetical protein
MVDLEKVAYDALREIYRKAEPGIDFDDVLENPEDYGENWYLNHKLHADRQEEILEKHLDKHNLSERERRSVRMAVILDYGPFSP